MSNNKKKTLYCAHCGKEIEDEYVMVGDNYLQVNFFEEQDGSDNIFCDSGCMASSLSMTFISKEDDEWPEESDKKDTQKDVDDSENTG